MPTVVLYFQFAEGLNDQEESSVSCRTRDDTQDDLLEPKTYFKVHGKFLELHNVGTPIALEVTTRGTCGLIAVHGRELPRKWRVGKK